MKIDTRDLEYDLKQAMLMCGGEDAYQGQIQSSYNTSIRLLKETPDPKASPDPALADLAKQVNDFLEPKAKLLLKKKRQDLEAAGKLDEAQHAEFTVLATKHGLQLAYSYAMEEKEVAPIPRKPFLRRALGPLYPGRKFWTMPQTDADGPGKVRTVWWPWIVWAIILLILGFGGFVLATGNMPLVN